MPQDFGRAPICSVHMHNLLTYNEGDAHSPVQDDPASPHLYL